MIQNFKNSLVFPTSCQPSPLSFARHIRNEGFFFSKAGDLQSYEGVRRALSSSNLSSKILFYPNKKIVSLIGSIWLKLIQRIQLIIMLIINRENKQGVIKR